MRTSSLPPRMLSALLALLVSLAGCARLFFYPDRVLRIRPDELGLEYRDVLFESGDGVQLHGWLLPARAEAGEPVGTVVFLHGNAQNISAHIASVYWMPSAGFHVFLVDYRGYGTSQGNPSIEDVHRDAEAAIRRAASLPGVDPGRIAVFGQSLGGAIAPTAVQRVRSEVPVRALVLDSAFSDFRDIAREKLAQFWLTRPLQAALARSVPDDIRPLDALAHLSGIEVLIVHGQADAIVAVEHAERLHGAAGAGSRLWLVPGAHHIDALRDPTVRAGVAEFLREALSSSAAQSSLSSTVEIPMPAPMH